MFGIPCGSYCFTRTGERSSGVLNITTNNRKRAPASSYEEIELKCHNNLADSRSELLYLNGRYYRRLPRATCREQPARRKLKLELPSASFAEPPSRLGNHTNEQINRISIIDVTNDDNSYEEPPVGDPIVEVEGSKSPEAAEEFAQAPLPAAAAITDKDQELGEASFELQLIKQGPHQPPPVSQERASQLAVAVDRPPQLAEVLASGGGICKQPRSLVRRFHEMLSMRHQQQQQIAGAPFTVMISYVHAEAQRYALSLKKELKRLGVSVYLDLHEIDKGSDWQDSLNRAVLSCQAFVPLVTPSYGQTLWTGREIKLADVLAKQIIPVNFGQRWPPPALAIQFATIQYVSWLAPDERDPNARPMMRTFKLRRRAGAGEVVEQSHWHKSCIRSVARQIKHAIEQRQRRIAAAAEMEAEPCYCRAHSRCPARALPAASSHDSGYSDSSPILASYWQDATGCALLQPKPSATESDYGSFRAPPTSLDWLKNSLDDNINSDSCNEGEEDESASSDDEEQQEVGTPDSVPFVTTNADLANLAHPSPSEKAAHKKRKSSSSSFVSSKNVSKFLTKFKKKLASAKGEGAKL